MQREPLGDVWETLVNPDTAELVSGFNEAERVHRPHHRWHYSNLVFSMLGEVVARLDGRPWAESLQARILDPLEMRRTTVGFSGRHAQGYYVPPWTDVPVPQDQLDLRALNPCGGLASTGEDLARWSAFVADPVSEVLATDTVEEMCEPQVVMDRERWTAAMGLGFFLVRSGPRTYVGHTGGMPGHITALFTDREARTGGIALTSSGATPDISRVRGHARRPGHRARPRRAGAVAPGHGRPTGARRSPRASGTPRAAPSPSRSAKAGSRPGPRVCRSTSRRPGSSRSGPTCSAPSPDVSTASCCGSPATPTAASRKMNWATYLVTRAPLAFGEWL